MNDNIRHAGIIDSIEDGIVRVRILQTSACAACKVARHCNASESKEKLVDVTQADGRTWKVGDAVTVCASRKAVSHAMLLAFATPLMLMVVTLVVVLLLTGNEATAGLSSLAVLIPYYIALWLLRNLIGRKISFHIED